MTIVGIDLGTTHSAVASVRPELGPQAPIEDLAIPQLIRPGEVAARPLLPSCVYLPAGFEFPPGALQLPWGPQPHPVGDLARSQGARVPGRLIASAKSWLSHPGVDRTAPILPWGAPPEVERQSPVDASAEILRHLSAAWDATHPEAPLSQQEVVLTVPASFDEVARALTVTAAQRAGLGKLILLEEPQAAFYDFTARHRGQLARALGDARLVLVVDVGGGTTDFTLIQAELSPEGPLLRRIAVGDHLLLGGDNMDAALAHHLEGQRSGQAGRLPPAAWAQLVQAARAAKEALLSAQPPEQQRIALALEGSRLLGGVHSFELKRDDARALLREGFFPSVGPDELPRRAFRGALQELGLPYAPDPAITRHLVAFLRQHAAAAFGALGDRPKVTALPRPDAVLLNGGVFNSPALAARLMEVLSALWPDQPPLRLLAHDSLDKAVARGAAYYGLVRKGLGLKIGGGAARAYYVGVSSAEGPVAVCLIPRGFEEGQSVRLSQQPLQLLLNRPVQFRLYSSSADRADSPGAQVPLSEDLKPLPPLHTLLTRAQPGQGEARVELEASLTEIGTLALACVATQTRERWRLEFELRGSQAAAELTRVESMPERFGKAREWVERIYGNRPLPVGPKDVKQLLRNLEAELGPREGWRLPVLRELWGALFAGAGKRRRSADHERVFFQLLGYTLRPGFGYPLDAWRCQESFSLFEPLVQFHGEKPNWTEFWILWRRLAGGLSEAAHQTLYDYLRPHLERRLDLHPPKQAPKLKGVVPEGLDEMVRAAASLEHLAPSAKEELGDWILAWLQAEPQKGGPWAWALGRLGARAPLFGSSHRTAEPAVAARWLEALLSLGLDRIDGAPFAAAQLARRTGDRARDLEPELQERTEAALKNARAPDSFVELVREVLPLEAWDAARALGDTLPAGLVLA